MITILKSGYYKIMRLFYNNKTAKLHLREIARRSKLHEPSTTKFLSSLEQDKILKSEKDGNLKKFSIRKNNVSYFIFEMFDIEKLDKLPDIRRKSIHCYLEALPEKPIFAILFGSTAKETYNESSDVDILIVANKKIDVKMAEKEADALAGIKISSFQIDYRHFLKELRLKEDKVVQSAVNTGYPIINNVAYYEVMCNEGI